MSSAVRQFQLCSQFKYPGLKGELSETSRYEKESHLIDGWYRKFCQEVHEPHLSYPNSRTMKAPELEDEMNRILGKLGYHLKPNEQPPKILLSHDIDNIFANFRMWAKRLIGYRRLIQLNQSYVDSIKEMVAIDNEASQKKGRSTLFVALTQNSPNLVHRLKQKIMDPHYNVEMLKKLVEELEGLSPSYGLHGSFFSLKDDFISKELDEFKSVFNKPATIIRQHWLHIPNDSGLSKIADAGVKFDSTLGWNGSYGYRGGLGFPYPVLLSPEKWIIEIPMVFMDGALFDDLKFTSEKVVESAKETLSPLINRGGCVSINWHDRSFHKDFNWGESYFKIVKWAKSEGFEFICESDLSEYEW